MAKKFLLIRQWKWKGKKQKEISVPISLTKARHLKRITGAGRITKWFIVPYKKRR